MTKEQAITQLTAGFKTRNGNLVRRMIYNAATKAVISNPEDDRNSIILEYNSSLNEKQRQDFCVRALKAINPSLNNVHIAAILGYVKSESRFYSAIVNGRSKPFEYATSGSGSLGLGQWLWYTRFQGLIRSYPNNRIELILDPGVQLSFMIKEAMLLPGGFWNKFLLMKDINAAARYWKEQYGGTSEREYSSAKYISAAKVIYKDLTS